MIDKYGEDDFKMSDSEQSEASATARPKRKAEAPSEPFLQSKNWREI